MVALLEAPLGAHLQRGCLTNFPPSPKSLHSSERAGAPHLWPQDGEGRGHIYPERRSPRLCCPRLPSEAEGQGYKHHGKGILELVGQGGGTPA